MIAAQLVATAALASPVNTLELCTRLDLNGSTVGLPRNTPATPSADGSVFPVLFIHGFTDTSATWTRPALASWSDPPTVTNPMSFVNMIGTIPGALPVLFDYEKHSLDWVDSPAIGEALRTTIACLIQNSGNQVAIVGHSMGGLAARLALGDALTASYVSLVVTIGTPNLGSFLPIVATEAPLSAAAVAQWAETASQLGARTPTSAAFLNAYHAWLSYYNRCQRQIKRGEPSGVCGPLEPLVTALASEAGRALASGSDELLALPDWPSTGITVHALSSNYLGFGADEWLGDGVVYPDSATAGAPQSTSTECQLTGLPWRNELGPRRNGCWHSDQPANQNVIPLAMTLLRDDITSRRPIDWQNTSYSITCAGIVPDRVRVELLNGAGTASAGGGYDAFQVAWSATATGDLTGDGRSETAVLLSCAPRPSNFFVEDVQVFNADGSLLGELPNADTLDPEGILPPEYVRDELTIENSIVSAGMRLYGPGDSHASGPSARQTFEWRWNGSSFEPVSDGQSRSTEQYTSHDVSRFGFSTELPNSFSILSTSANGDGLALQSRDGRAEVSIYGTNNGNGESAAQVRDAYVTDAQTNGGVVTYQNVTGNAATVTGQTSGADIFYYHLVVGPGSINAISWTYPVTEKAKYDEAVTRSVRSLQVGDLTQPH